MIKSLGFRDTIYHRSRKGVRHFLGGIRRRGFDCQDGRRAELRRLIVARRCLCSARLSLGPGSTQREDHTRWTGPSQNLVFSSSFPFELEASIKTILVRFFWVCAYVCLWCQSAK